MNTYIVRRRPEPGSRWFVRDAGSGAVPGWFDCQLAHWYADEQQRHSGRKVEIGYRWRSLCQPRHEPDARA